MSPLMPKFKTIAPLGASRLNGEISLLCGLQFVFCDPTFCSHPETKPQNGFSRSLTRMMSISGYYILIGIKIYDISVFPNFNPPPTLLTLMFHLFMSVAETVKRIPCLAYKQCIREIFWIQSDDEYLFLLDLFQEFRLSPSAKTNACGLEP